MKKTLLIILTICLFVILPSFSEHRKSVLIIHSYSDSYEWTHEIMLGIKDYLDPMTIYYVEYLDTKNFMNENYLDQLNNLLTYKYKEKTIDAVITTDDIAFDMATKLRDQWHKTMPIFFCGVNSETGHDFASLSNVYGVLEIPSVNETLKVAYKQQPNLSKVYVIVDDSVTGNLARIDIKNQLKGSPLEVIYFNKFSLNDILLSLDEIDEPNSIILLAFYIVDIDQYVYAPDEMTQLISKHAKIPLFGLWDFSLEHGIIGGKLISAYSQGKRVAEITNDQLSGMLAIDSKYYEKHSGNQNMYDYNEMLRFNVPIKYLPKDSLILNQPVSFYNNNKELILGSLLIIIILTVYIIVLRSQVKKHTKQYIRTHQQLIEADKMASMGEMMYRISHELNTPLGTSLTTASYIDTLNLEMLNEFEKGKLSKKSLLEKTNKIDHSVNLLVKSLESATGLMNAFKTFSDIQETSIITSFDLGHYLENLIKTYQPILERYHHKINLKISFPLIIKGKSKDYYCIINELIRNSLEHGFKDTTHKEISLVVYKKNNTLTIVYSDNGFGIESARIDKIFTPLYKFTTNKSHLGLGLSNVYNIITSLKGTISCETNSGINTTFTIKLPQPSLK